MDMDIAFLRAKQDRGAKLLMAQLCHSVDNYCRFMDKLRAAGVSLPVDVGIMPPMVKEPTINMTISSGCSIPAELAAIMRKYGNSPEDFKKAGKEWTVELIYQYMAAGAQGLHLYTLNNADDVTDILQWSGLGSHR